MNPNHYTVKCHELREFIKTRPSESTVEAKGDNTPTPTKFRPGSIGKIKELIMRVEKNQALWHPGDAGWEGKP